MISPPHLQKGDVIAIVSPAKKIEAKAIDFAIKFYEERGYKVLIGKNALGEWNNFSGTESERIADFQWALNHKEIKAILCARGGYGSVNIVDQLDFSNFCKNPKWIIGFSDVTVFHNHIVSNFNISTLHGPMAINIYNTEEEIASAKFELDLIEGKSGPIVFKNHPLNQKGKTTGKLVGGNLAVFSALIGTNSDLNTDNTILFLEDLCEEIYKLDRMLFQLKKSKKLENLKGVLVGGFTNMTDKSNWFNQNSYERIAQHFSGLNIPIAFNFPAGHIVKNTALVIGGTYDLNIGLNEVKLTLK